MSRADCTRCGHQHLRREECEALVPIPERPHLGMPCGCIWGSAMTTTAAERYVPIGVRRAVIERDGLRCQICGTGVRPHTRRTARISSRRALHLDHIVPFSKGGQHAVDNLRVLCASCNIRRGNREHYPEG